MRIIFGVNLEAKFGRDHYLVTEGCESLAHEFFIHEWTVNFSGIEESDAAFDRSPNEGNHLLSGRRYSSVTWTQPHAAQADGGDFEIVFPSLRFFILLPLAYGPLVVFQSASDSHP